jgi:hypothetical protein
MSSSRISADDGERVIDRSGDIDQRPPDERSNAAANIVLFSRMGAETATCAPLYRAEEPAAQAPQLSRQGPSPALADLAARLQKDLERQFDKAKAHLDALTRKIEVQEKRCILPRLDGDLQQVRFQRQKTLIASGPALATHLREERSRLADLERFKSENRISREAHYPASPLLGFGVLSVLILVEACINGVLFADSSDRGLFGGWLEAMVLAITNVGVAFLAGHLLLPQINRRGLFAKAGAVVLGLAGGAALVAVNLFGAHYRDFKAATARLEVSAALPESPRRETSIPISGQKTATNEALALKARQPATSESGFKKPSTGEDRNKRSEIEALRKVFQAPFELESFTSLFLLVIGLCAATIAAADGYKFDDPFPGYGKRCRRYAEARAKSAVALHRVVSHANGDIAATFQSLDRKLDAHARELAELHALHHAYAGDSAAMTNRLDEAARSGESEIARNGRFLSKMADRDALDRYALSVPALPPLNEKHARFYENQDKKLKALQKAVQKEKDESLGVFNSVSGDFEKLLTEAIQASFQTGSPAHANAQPAS